MDEKKRTGGTIRAERIRSLQVKWGDRIFISVVYAVIIIVTLCCLYPIYYTVIASVSEPNAVAKGQVSLLPVGTHFRAYIEVFKNSSIWRGYANTILYTVAGTVFNLFLTIPCAYALSKERLFGRAFLTVLFIITMYFGGGMIPTYLLYKSLHMMNTRWIMIIGGGLSVYNTVVTRTYFQNNIPESLYESARIDGAGEFRIFARIALPLSAPIIAVIALYYAVGHWGAYFNAMIYLTDSSLHPLQLVLRRILIMNENMLQEQLGAGASAEALQDAVYRSQLAYVMKFALVFIASAPMLVLYPFVQKYFVKGMMIGSLKG